MHYYGLFMSLDSHMDVLRQVADGRESVHAHLRRVKMSRTNGQAHGYQMRHSMAPEKCTGP